MSFLSTISRLASDYRARRQRLDTYLQVSSLPREIQKDIGWPDAFANEEGPRRNARRR